MNFCILHTLNKGVLSDLNEVCLDVFHLTTFCGFLYIASHGPLFQNEGRCSAFDMEIIFILMQKTHFHKKDCAPSLILNMMVFGTPK